jgi:hypothetical protein
MRLPILLIVLAGSLLGSIPAYAGTIQVDFNSGTADGWLSIAPAPNYGLGNWRIENGILVEDLAGDHYKFLLDTPYISAQSIETQLYIRDYGAYGGITIWYQDYDNFVSLLIYPGSAGYGGPGNIRIHENVNGNPFAFYYPDIVQPFTWYDLRIDANSATGELGVYVNNIFLFSHIANTPNRLGSSGLNAGNAGVYFDNFSLSSNDISAIPEPSTLALLGTGILRLVGYVWRRSFQQRNRI